MYRQIGHVFYRNNFWNWLWGVTVSLDVVSFKSTVRSAGWCLEITYWDQRIFWCEIYFSRGGECEGDSLLGYYAVSLVVYRRFRGIYCLLLQIVRMFGAVSTSDTSLNFTKLQYSRELSCSENFLFISSLPCKWMLTFCFQITSPLPHAVTSIHILSSFSYHFYKRIRRIAWSVIELILIPFLKDECQMLAGNTL
jgi:hypothetical protein